MTTELLKLYVGELRPIFYDQCQPNADYSACTNTSEKDVTDARKSFPSGHSSMSFCGMQLLTLYLLQRFGLESSRHVYSSIQQEAHHSTSDSTTTPWRHERRLLQRKRLISVLCLAPMAVAVFIAASRLRDNRHHPADVVGGAVLGASLGQFGHGLW